MKRFYSCLFFWLISWQICLAQNYLDLASVFYSNTPLNQFDSTLNKTRVQDFSFTSTLPIKLNDKTFFIAGLDYEWLHTKLTPQGTQGSVSGLILKLGINRKLNEKWTGNFIFIPRLASDFESAGGGISSEDIQLGGLVLFKYKAREYLSYKLAMYYNTELFGPFFSPIVGLYYKKPGKKFEADISLPFLVDLNYRLAPQIPVGLRFNAFVRTYYLHNAYYHNNGEYLAKTSNEMYTYIGYEMKNGLFFKASVGYSIGRNYRLYDVTDKVAWGLSAFRFGDKRQQLNADFSDGMLFRADLIYRIYPNGK